MSFSLSRLLGNKKEEPEQLDLSGFQYKGGTKFARNATNEMYLDVEELGGFPFLRTVIIGTLNVNVKRFGGSLEFKFKKDTLTLESDNTTISSTQVAKTGVHVTEIDFQITEEEVKRIKKEKIFQLTYTFKKKSFDFKPYS